MVRGDWIVNVEKMRCKNWVNGMEITFGIIKGAFIVGKIQYIPQELIETIPVARYRALYIYKMWRNAMEIFKKVYFKKTVKYPFRVREEINTAGNYGYSYPYNFHAPAIDRSQLIGSL
jgi:hypothetical protein